MTPGSQQQSRTFFTSRRQCWLWIATVGVLVGDSLYARLARAFAQQFSGLGLGV